MIRVLALIEASRVTGKARNLIEFGVRARRDGGSRPAVELAIATFLRGTLAPNAFIAAARSADIPVFTLTEKRRFDPSPMKQLPGVIAEWRPDVIETHNVKSHFLVRSLGLAGKYPWVAFHHGYTATDLKDRFYNQFDRWSLPGAQRVVTVCELFARKLSSLGVSRERIRVQHNSVAPFVSPAEQAIRAVREKLRIETRNVVLVIGRLSREKGHQDLLQAVALLGSNRSLQDTCFVIVGDGPEREQLVRIAAQYGLNGRVVFAGHQADVRPYYAIGRVLALPSHTEGSPYVILEAMAAGLPVIATEVGGVPEIIAHDQTGIVVPARRPNAMAQAIERLLCDEWTRHKIAETARAMVATRYTREAHCQALIEMYREVLEPTRHSVTDSLR